MNTRNLFIILEFTSYLNIFYIKKKVQLDSDKDWLFRKSGVIVMVLTSFLLISSSFEEETRRCALEIFGGVFGLLFVGYFRSLLKRCLLMPRLFPGLHASEDRSLRREVVSSVVNCYAVV